MVWRLWVWRALLLAVPTCQLVGGQLAPQYGFASDIDMKVYQFNNFMVPKDCFTFSLNFDAVPGKIVVGAKGKLYLLGDDLTLVQSLDMTCDQTCPNNLVRLYSAPYTNPTTLVVCGSAGPLCTLVNTANEKLAVATSYVKSNPQLISSDPNILSTGVFFNVNTSRNTNFFAASGNSLTFHSFNPNDPESLNNSLKFGFIATNFIFNVSTWFSSSLVIVDVYKADYPMRAKIPDGALDDRTADEHKYFFVFVREQDPTTLVVTNKMVRLCQNDPGSNSTPNGLPFPTALLKANISCQSISGPLRPNLLQGVVFSRPGRYYPGGEWVELMYGAFTDYTGYVPQTSICVYRANDSDFQGSGSNNKGVFDIFRSQVYDPVSAKTVANNFVECNINGRTDLQAQRINVIQAIVQYNADPLAILSNVVITKMAVDQPYVLNGSLAVQLDVLFLGTNSGSVLKLAMTTSANGTLSPFISEKIQLGDLGSVRQMNIISRNGVKHLYVNTDNAVYKIPLERCYRYLDCAGCVASRDPYCVWDTSINKCVNFSGVLTGNAMFKQNINTGAIDDCSGSYGISSPTSPPTTSTVAGIATQARGTSELLIALGVTVPIIVILVLTLIVVCLHAYHCSKTGSTGEEMKKAPKVSPRDGRSVGSPNSIVPLTPCEGSAVPDSPAHIYDTTPGEKVAGSGDPPKSAPHLYGVLEAVPPKSTAANHVYGELELNGIPVYTSLKPLPSANPANAATAQAHEYSVA